MTKAKAARISLAMILAFALLLCGFAIFRSDARAEETAIENGGEYMIVFARTEADGALHYWAATSTISSNALVMVDLGTSLPASVAPTEENASRTFILSKTADAETYQIVAKGISGTSNYHNIASTSKTNVSFGGNGENAIFDLVSNGDGTYNIFATATLNAKSQRDLSIAKANTNEPAAKFYAKTASNESTYIFDAYLVPVKETSFECDHSTTSTVNEKAATCTEDGYTGDVVCSCGATISKGQVIASEGHKYVDGTCSACGAEAPSSTDYSGNYYIATKRSSGNYWYMTSTLTGSGSSRRYQAVDSGLTTLPTSVTGGIINQIFTIVSNGDGTYKIYANGVEGNNYLGWTSGNYGILVSEDSALNVTIAKNGDCVNIIYNDARYLSLNNSNSYFAWYTGTQTQDLILVPVEEADEECTHTETKTENKKDATCTEDGYTGDVVCSSCGITVTEGQVIASEGHKYVDGTCSACGAEDPTSTDYSGTYYIATIRSSGNYFYMTSDLGTASTKRYQAVDSGLTTLPAFIADVVDVQIFTIVSNGDGTYKIYANGVDGDNYLGHTSGNSGALVAEDDALNVTIDANDDGTFNIHYTASDAERYLALNSASTSNYFAWYKSGQKQDLALVPVEEAGETESDFKITGAQVNAGTSLKVTYRVEVNAGALAEGDKLAMKFTRNGETVTITLEYSESGEYLFTIGGIAPHQMGDPIDAELIAIKGGNEEVVGSKAGYSVEENLINLANTYKDDAKLVALIHDMLAYGKAAQAYKEYNTSDVIGDGFTITPSTATPDQSDAAKFSGTDTYIYSAGVRFDDVNKLYFIFKDLGDATVTVNGKEYTTDDMVDMGDGYHKLYTGAISATQLGTVYTVVAGNSTLTYSTSAYALSKMSDDNMGELALALYRYGVSAKAYVEAN